MSPDLQVLAEADNHDALLLAEVAAWLHDMGKCADEHITHQASDRPASSSYHYKTAHSKLVDTAPSLSLLSETIKLRTLVERARPRIVNDATQPWLLRVLARCHAAAHIEKEEADRTGKQPMADTRMSTAYGFESAPVNGLTAKLQALSFHNLTDRSKFREEVTEAFTDALGETRRPENEITLWDWSNLVAALYKSALAGALLGHQPAPSDLRWRLLSVRVDHAAFVKNATRFPDLLARQQLLQDAFDHVRVLIEERYPLGTEVYRDEGTSIYVVPNVSNLCSLTDKTGKSLNALIRHAFAEGTIDNDSSLSISAELIPFEHFDSQAWWGQRPDFRHQPASMDEVPPIAEHLQSDVVTATDPVAVKNWWHGISRDICTVCGLRPQGPSPKAEDRNVCDICEQRRADRAREWALEKLHTTIWTDEVADVNGRLALVVGYFDLTHWLSGDLVRTLAVRNPENVQKRTADEVAKNPSFARLRRIWETTRAFWQDIAPTDDDTKLPASLSGESIDQGEPRLEIKGALHPAKARNALGPYHTYELVLNRGVKLSVVWDQDNRRFITCDNLEYLAGESQLGQPVEDVLKRGSVFTIEEPAGYGARNKAWGTITLTQDAEEISGSTYTPVIPILVEPRTFMALVPANKALAVVQAIKAKYEQEMGKVRNRLPLHLGVVYAGRRTPLASVLDAGRRMLRQSGDAAGWQVKAVRTQPDDGGILPERFRDDARGQFAKWYEIDLEKDGRQLTWYVPAMMGDGQTDDHWYPYVFLNVSAEPTNGKHRFQAPNPWTGQTDWLVHAGDLRKGDTVYFTPATLDFQWLDSAARRFEIAYEENTGTRRGRAPRPYLLDEVETLETIWETLKHHLTKNQIYALRDLIEAKREEWDIPAGESTFRQFCRDALANADWRKGRDDQRRGNYPWQAAAQDRDRWLDTWTGYAARGWLADAIELHLQIMKEVVAS